MTIFSPLAYIISKCNGFMVWFYSLIFFSNIIILIILLLLWSSKVFREPNNTEYLFWASCMYSSFWSYLVLNIFKILFHWLLNPKKIFIFYYYLHLLPQHKEGLGIQKGKYWLACWWPQNDPWHKIFSFFLCITMVFIFTGNII